MIIKIQSISLLLILSLTTLHAMEPYDDNIPPFLDNVTLPDIPTTPLLPTRPNTDLGVRYDQITSHAINQPG